MAKYRLLQRTIIDDVQREVGYEFEYEGVPGPHMEPIDAAAKKAVADRDAAAAPGINPDFQAHPAETAPPGVPPMPPPPTETVVEDKDKEKEDRGHGRRG